MIFLFSGYGGAGNCSESAGPRRWRSTAARFTESAARSAGSAAVQQLANLGQGLAGILGGRAEQEDSEGEEGGEVEEVVAVVDGDGQYSDTTASAPGSDDRSFRHLWLPPAPNITE